MFWSSNTVQHSDDGNQRSCDRRPEAREQKYPTAYPKDFKNGGLDRQSSSQRGQPVQDQRSAGDTSQQKKAHAGQAFGKCRI